jgi:hypothetical protein
MNFQIGRFNPTFKPVQLTLTCFTPDELTSLYLLVHSFEVNKALEEAGYSSLPQGLLEGFEHFLQKEELELEAIKFKRELRDACKLGCKNQKEE